jgi:ParB family chromosome partitioning protein
LKRVDQFLNKPLSAALEVRNERDRVVLELDDLIVGQVDALKAKGMTSPYLKSLLWLG